MVNIYSVRKSMANHLIPWPDQEAYYWAASKALSSVGIGIRATLLTSDCTATRRSDGFTLRGDVYLALGNVLYYRVQTEATQTKYLFFSRRSSHGWGPFGRSDCPRKIAPQENPVYYYFRIGYVSRVAPKLLTWW